MDKKTKIVCTIGPASNSVPTLVKLMKAGMNVARLNFSHGTYPAHAALIKSIKVAAKQTGQIIPLLQDLQGPRIRLGVIPKEGVSVKNGETVVFSTSISSYFKNKIPVTYKKLSREVRPGDRILVADGLFEFVVKNVKGGDVVTKVVNGGLLTSNKGMNLPDTKLSISSVSDKDLHDLDFGIKQGVDFIALSFVRNSKDVISLRKRIEKLEKKYKNKEVVRPQIIVKIEMREAIENFDSILEVADGVMVARGDLGIEMPPEQVPLLQKELIEKCNLAGKPVIVATQMLESMVVNPRPTRAEISDIANAVIDKTDAVMLSGETAMGKFPVEAVTYMSKTISSTEMSAYDDVDYGHKIWTHVHHDEAIAAAASVLTLNSNVSMMVVLSMKGMTARLVSKHRPKLPIIVTTPSARVARQLQLSWGVTPVLISKSANDTSILNSAIKIGQSKGYVKKGDQIILIKGHPLMKKRLSHRSIELFRLGD